MAQQHCGPPVEEGGDRSLALRLRRLIQQTDNLLLEVGNGAAVEGDAGSVALASIMVCAQPGGLEVDACSGVSCRQCTLHASYAHRTAS